MFDIFKELSITSDDSQSSRLNAQEYTEKILESIDMLKSLYDICNKKTEAKRLVSTDVVIQTAAININGKSVSLKMAFNCASKTPYAVEIMEEIKE